VRKDERKCCGRKADISGKAAAQRYIPVSLNAASLAVFVMNQSSSTKREAMDDQKAQ
jgi:hypothetical protein